MKDQHSRLGNMSVATREGFVKVLGYRLFFRSFGTPKQGTILSLHGGPGVTHDYLLPLADLADHGYRVLFYDQLGCGKSEVPKDTALFVPERYVEEIEGFRRAMDLGRVHLIGSSWGGALALAYALRYQKSVRSLVTIGGLHSVPLVDSEMQRMIGRLPSDVRKTLARYESVGDYDNPEYIKAADVFHRRFACRLKDWPNELNYSMAHMNKTMSTLMSGPNPFKTTGNTRYWDIANQLHRITVPTLIVTGRYDMVSPRIARDIKRRIAGSRLVVLPRSSHNPFWEERDSFTKIVSEFLREH